MSILEFQNVGLTYHSSLSEVEAIKNLSFKVEEGEFVAIVGPSGCGKTTVLSVVSGLIKVTSGKILFKGKEEIPENLGYMLQKDCLFDWRTILENLTIGLEIKKQLNKESLEYVKSLLKKYNLFDFANKYPKELSGGMRQRAALIRTLATKPPLLLLDEPTSSLDYQTRLTLCDDLYKIIKDQGKTTLLVTHDISEAISLADKIIVLTNRPATLKDEIPIEIKADTPLKKRESEKFSKYFEKIWKELN